MSSNDENFYQSNDNTFTGADARVSEMNVPALMAAYQLRQREYLLRITRAMTSRLDLSSLLRLILNCAAELVGCRAGLVVLKGETTSDILVATQYKIRAYYGIADKYLPDFQPLLNVELLVSFHIDKTMNQHPDMLELQESVRKVENKLDIPLGQVIGLPLLLEDEILGIIYLFRTEYAFTQLDWQFLQGFADQAAIAVNNANLYDQQLQSIEELKRLDKQKSEFISTISHELRTPLTAVKSCIEGFLNETYGSITSRQRSRLEIALSSVNDESRLVENLLDLVRIQENRVGLFLENVKLIEIIQSVIYIFEYDAAQFQIMLEAKILSTKDLVVTVDRAKIKQVLSNLIHNALKFSYPGGKVTVYVEKVSDNIVVKIVDFGIGIPEDKVDAIFDRFYQVDSSLTRHVGGTGIGLSIVKEYVEMHGGSLNVVSAVGKGSTFTFTLPLTLGSFKE